MNKENLLSLQNLFMKVCVWIIYLWCDAREEYNIWFKLNIQLNVWKLHQWNIWNVFNTSVSIFNPKFYLTDATEGRNIQCQWWEITDSGRLHTLFLLPAQSSVGMMVNRQQQLFNILNFKDTLIGNDVNKEEFTPMIHIKIIS